MVQKSTTIPLLLVGSAIGAAYLYYSYRVKKDSSRSADFVEEAISAEKNENDKAEQTVQMCSNWNIFILINMQYIL